MKLSQVVCNLNGTLIQDGNFDGLDFVTSETDTHFLTFMEKERFLDQIGPNAVCVLCKQEFVDKMPATVKGIFVTDEPKYCFYQIHNRLYSKRELPKSVIDPTAMIASTAVIASNGVDIGKGVIIEDGVVIYENVSIEENSIIHSNCVIGGRSFDFARGTNGKVIGWTDAGRVRIGKNVEICSLCHVTQGVLETDVTEIDDNAKLDVLIYVGHGARIGKGTFVTAGVQIGGNTKIGDNVWLGLNATIANRLTIGNNARVTLGSVVTKSVDENATVTGNFAIDHGRFLMNLKKSISHSDSDRGGVE